jgi:hypothetical protein
MMDLIYFVTDTVYFMDRKGVLTADLIKMRVFQRQGCRAAASGQRSALSLPSYAKKNCRPVADVHGNGSSDRFFTSGQL